MHKTLQGDCYCDELGFHPCMNLDATAENSDLSVSEVGTSALSANGSFRILNEPAYEIRRFQETPNRIRVVMGQNLCIYSYVIQVVTLPPKPPKEKLPKDFPAVKVFARRAVGRLWTRWRSR